MRAIEVGGKKPRIGASVFVADDATLIGAVELGDRSSIWFGSVLRGDVETIRVGEETNIQDLCVLHVDSGGFATTVGNRVTVGHRVVLHGCTVRDLALVGIGSVVLNGAEIGEEALLGAGSLVPPGMKIPAGVLALGAPAKVIRPLRAEEKRFLRESAANYVRNASLYAPGGA